MGWHRSPVDGRRADPDALGRRRLDFACPGRNELPHAARAVAERTATGTPRTANENLVTRTVCPCKRQVPSSLLVNLVKDVPHYDLCATISWGGPSEWTDRYTSRIIPRFPVDISHHGTLASARLNPRLPPPVGHQPEPTKNVFKCCAFIADNGSIFPRLTTDPWRPLSDHLTVLERGSP